MPTDCRLLTDHTPEADYHEWVFLGDTERRDAIGRQGNSGWHRWLVVICNNTECAGRAIVRAGLVTDLAESRFPVPSGRDREER